MKSVLRAAIACLLLIALPLQGYSAGTMLFCGASIPAAGVSGHEHEDVYAAHHDEAASADADGAATDYHDAMHGKCSVCSSCCSAAALPATPVAATSATLRAAPLPELEHADRGFGPARLERPPRLSLA